MKRQLFAIFSGIATLFVLGIAQNLPAQDDHPCSQQGVAGLWGFSLTGNLDGTPSLAAGTLTIDRYGNLTGGGTFNVGGGVTDEVFTGTVTVNRDCSGHLSLPQYPINYDVWVVNDSREMFMVSRDVDLVFSADAKRMSPGKD